MRRSISSTLSRRQFLSGIAGLIAAIVAACIRSDDDPTQAGSDPTEDDPSADQARGTSTSTASVRAEPTGARTNEPVNTPQEDAGDSTPAGPGINNPATNTPTPSPTPIPTIPPELWPSVRTRYAAVVSRRLQVRDVSYDDLERLWDGDITNWGALGDPDQLEIQRLTVAGQSGPMPPERRDLDVAEFDDLEAFLAVNRGGIAIVPVDRVDFRYRTLRIDGVNAHTSSYDEYRLHLEQRYDPSIAPPPPATGDSTPETVMMTFVGDIIFGRYVHKRLAAIGDFSASFWDIADDLKVADLTIGDLECSLSDTFPQPEEADPQTFLFKTWTETVSGLTLADIDVLARANNHSFNFGATGMQDTTRTLDEAGILHFGMGNNLDEARAASVVEVKGTTYAFLGYNGISDQWDAAGPDWAGTAPLEEWLVVEDIQREVAAGHVVIPYFHWGVEYVADPTEQQRYFAHLAIDNGAAMVMGSHPHWVQAVETYNGKAVIYSLGNFVFDQAWSRETMEGMYANVWLQGSNVVEIDLIPILIEDEHRPRRMDRVEAKPVLERVWNASDRIINGT